MEKISGILPANARVTTVDLRNSGTSRAGMPSWGREVGVTAAAEKQIAADKLKASTAAKAAGSLQQQMELRGRPADPKSDIVQRLADDFFMNKKAEPKTTLHVWHDADADMKIDNPPIELANPEDFASMDDVAAVPAEDGAPEGETLATGHYLDVRA